MNGREILFGHEQPYHMAEDQRYRTNAYAREAITGDYERTPLSDLFFSSRNIDALQRGMRNVVLNESKGKYTIDRQSDTELQVVMRGIFFEHAHFLPYDVVGQVQELNKRVLEYVVPRIINEIEMYLKYQYDVTTLPVPLPRGQISSMKGSRTLEIKHF
jgi:hypothetical protein